MQNQTQNQPVRHVRCSHPGCGLPLRYLSTQMTEILYGCSNGHIRKVARPDGKRVSIQWNGPNNAA